jgi:hypothetical protein
VKLNKRWLIIFGLMEASWVWAKPTSMVQLKRVLMKNDQQMELVFDQKISPDQIKTEFFNDIIQLTLKDVAVYPAHMSTLSGKTLLKVFAYQYSPDITRCRFTVKGKAEDFREAIRVRSEGKVVSVILGGAGENNQDQIQVHAAGANRAEPLSAGISLAQLVKKDEETLKKIVAEDAPTKETKELKDSREGKETKKINQRKRNHHPLPGFS